MTSLMKSPRRVLVAGLVAIVVPALLVSTRAQDRTNGNGGSNGIPQQIAELRAQLADAKAMIANLQAAVDRRVDAEAAARMAADSMLQNNIDTEASMRLSADTMLQNSIDAGAAEGGAQIDQLRQAFSRLPAYLIDAGTGPAPNEDNEIKEP